MNGPLAYSEIYEPQVFVLHNPSIVVVASSLLERFYGFVRVGIVHQSKLQTN